MIIVPALAGVAVGTGIAIPPLAYYSVAKKIRTLADTDRIFTYPNEASTKAITLNGEFSRFVMAYQGHCFAGEENPSLPEIDKWLVVEAAARQRRYGLPLLRGIRYVGLPPFSEVYRYHFSWASLEERQDDNGKMITVPVWKDIPKLNFILLQSDVYITKIELAECSDNIPLNASILVGGAIVNPFKALFKVQRWLEATNNAVNQRMRSFFGGKSYADLRTIQEAMRGGSGMPESLSTYFQETFAYIEAEWGFRSSFVQIYSIDPGSAEADAFIRASTRRYVAEQERDANIATGEGLAARDSRHLEAISRIPNGVDLFKWLQIAESNLTTYAEGGSARPVLPVGS